MILNRGIQDYSRRERKSPREAQELKEKRKQEASKFSHDFFKDFAQIGASREFEDYNKIDEKFYKMKRIAEDEYNNKLQLFR